MASAEIRQSGYAAEAVELTAAERIYLRALANARNKVRRRERGPLQRCTLAYALTLGPIAGIAAGAAVPFEWLRLWHGWWAPLACCVSGIGLLLWLNPKRFFDRLVGNR